MSKNLPTRFASSVPAFAAVLLLIASCKSGDTGPKQPIAPSPPAPPAPVVATDASQKPDAARPATLDASALPPMQVQDPSSKPPTTADDRDAGSDLEEADAGPWIAPEPICVDDEWLLAPGFLPAKRVDYIADRDLRFPDAGTVDAGIGFAGNAAPPPPPPMPVLHLISSAGIACANAKDRATCQAALALTPQVGRHLATTSGDTVRIWPGTSALPLLGAIDTTAEALWVLLVSRGDFGCKVKVTRGDGGFLVTGVPNFNCGALVDGGLVHNATTRVLASGEVMDILSDAGLGPPCPMP